MRNRGKNLELGWAVLVLIANFILFASHAWALGAGLPSMGDGQVAIRCEYYDGREQDSTGFATEQACLAAHDHCVKSCTVSAFSCIAQGVHSDGRPCREAGFSEISEADSRSRALASCLASGGEGCQILNCTEQKRAVSPNG